MSNAKFTLPAVEHAGALVACALKLLSLPGSHRAVVETLNAVQVALASSSEMKVASPSDEVAIDIIIGSALPGAVTDLELDVQALRALIETWLPGAKLVRFDSITPTGRKYVVERDGLVVYPKPRTV